VPSAGNARLRGGPGRPDYPRISTAWTGVGPRICLEFSAVMA
jgi:hypothetical protein